MLVGHCIALVSQYHHLWPTSNHAPTTPSQGSKKVAGCPKQALEASEDLTRLLKDLQGDATGDPRCDLLISVRGVQHVALPIYNISAQHLISE